MFNHGLASIALMSLVLLSLGCGPAASTTSEMSSELEAEIVAHDAAVAAAERAQK